MKLSVQQKGDFHKTENFLKAMQQKSTLAQILDKYGRAGVAALAANTPKESGLTAASWDYYVTIGEGRSSITWTNSHFAGTVPVVILLQYGHGTGTGGYVQGYDFINPTMRDIFDGIADDVWKAVQDA